jgi:diguanylate cyclase (GGDEF)-like protein/PAS domain S-box-containing protein
MAHIEGRLTYSQKAVLWSFIAKNTPDMIALLSGDGKVLWASSASVNFFKEVLDTFTTKPVFDRIHPDDRSRVLKEFLKVTEQDINVLGPVIFRLLSPEGTWLTVETTAYDLTKNPEINAILAITRDVTSRQEAITELAESEGRYRRLVERSPEPMAVYKNSTIVYANPSALRLIGASSIEHLKQYKVIDLVHPDDRELANKAFEPVDQGNDMHPIEIRLLSLDAQVIHAEVIGIPIIYDGEPGVQLVIRDITDTKQVKAALEYQALHDPLTGLPNRALFVDRVTQALIRNQKTNNRVVVLLADIDRFKIVNDSLSHSVGDQILIGVSQRIRSCFRPSDTVARFGGDEFVILCDEADDLTSLGSLGDRLIKSLDEPIVVNNEPFHISISVGIAESSAHTLIADDIIRNADAAMNRAKDRGRRRYVIMDETSGSEIAGRLQLESALRQGISKGELRAHFQPVVESMTGRAIGVEALVRWQREHGLESPATFIPLAEDSGLIVAIGNWMLAEALKHAKEWEELEDITKPFKVSVNISPRQFLEPGLVETVKDMVEGSKLDPTKTRLVLEVTETTLMADPDEAITILKAFNDMGVSIAIDDFGTGYSSFTYLKRFPVESIKIDRSFIMGLGNDKDDEAIVTAVIQVANTLNLDVIAEGVETDQQLERLKELGCTTIQGFYYSKPIPSDTIEDIIVSDLPLGN